MIITVTCNPAIDRNVSCNDSLTISGKGINVSKVLKVLGVDSLAIGFLGEENKNFILDFLDSKQIKHDFILVKGKTRTNTKRIINNELFEENEDGPYIDESSQQELINRIKTFHNDIVVLSGSIPSNVSRNFYYDLISILKENNNYVVLDTSKELLSQGIKAKPNMIKPNIKEFKEVFGDEDMILKAKELLDDGLDDVVISLEDKGSLYISKEGVYKANCPKLNYVSATCAGDSIVAGFIYSKIKNLDILDKIKICVSCASATVEHTDVFEDISEANKFLDQIEIEKII